MKNINLLIQNWRAYHFFRYPFSLLLAVSLFFLVGCASNTVNRSNQTSLIQQPPFKVTTELLNDGTPKVKPQSLADTLSEMIAQAEYYCAIETYVQADSVLKEIITFFEQIYIDSLSVKNQQIFTDYYNSIFEIYSELMPPEYIPEEISLQIEKRELLESLDSIVISDSDTILPLILKSLAETKFDIPIAYNERIQKACMFYLRNNRTTIKRWLTRSALYVPTMKKMFADSGLPLDLVYLPLIESGFNPKAYSHAHASGIWQFIPSTGKLFGLRNNYWVDERRDPLKATASAISYLKKLNDEFNHWHLALGAYNCGEGGMRRAIAKAGVSDYWKLKLPKETMNYVPLYLASLIIIKNSERFGFEAQDSTVALKYDTVMVSDCIDMSEIAKGIDMDIDTLRMMNPHILHWCTPPDMTDIRIYLPEGSTQNFQDFYTAIPDDKKVKWYRYRISSGDNLLTIAKKFNVPLEGIKTVNRMKSSRIIAGHYLFIPIPVNSTVPKEVATPQVAQTKKTIAKIVPNGPSTKYIVKKEDTLWNIADLFGVSVDDVCQWNGMSRQHIIKANDIIVIYKDSQGYTQNITPNTFVDYKVKQGDTPYSIANAFNMSLQHLITINNLDSKTPTLYAGEIVKVTSVNKVTEKSTVQKSIDNSSVIRYEVERGDNLWRIAQNFNVKVAEILSLNKLNETTAIKVGDILQIPSQKKIDNLVAQDNTRKLVSYEVKPGDNLWRIASSFGISINQLYAMNNLTSNSILMPGDVIKVTKAEDL